MNNQNEAEKKALEQLDQEFNESNAKEIQENVKSLGKIQRPDYTKEDVEEVNRKFGWHQIYPEHLPTSGLYYDTSITIKIKAATTNEIMFFSTVDDTDPLSANEAIIDLLKICCKVSFGNKQGSWKDLKDEDKVFVILSIRDLTFAEGENKLSFTVNCPSCNTPNEMIISNENFQKRTLHEKLQKYYNESTRQLEIESKVGNFTLCPPNLGIMKIVEDYILKIKKEGKDIKKEMPFLSVLPYMIKDWRGFTLDKITNLKHEFLSWDRKKFELFSKLAELFKVGVEEEMKTHCTSCEEVIEAKFKLPNGVKGLFAENDILDELL